MKIVHVVYSMEMGGAESLVAQLCWLQREHGHDVSVIAQATLGTLGERMRQGGFRVDVPGTGNPLRTFARWVRLFRELRPEVVHCHNVAPTIQAAPAARLTGARRILSTRHSLVAPPYDRKMELLYGVAARFCDAIVGICEATCANLRGAPLARKDRIVRVYNGAAPMPGVTAGERLQMRAAARGSAPRSGQERALSAPSGPNDLGAARATVAPAAAEPVVFLFVGRLAMVKDLGTMIRGFAQALRQRAELRLWVVGDGPERGRLEALAAELGVTGQVQFWGERHDVAGFFAAADVFAMSSVSEGLPMSLLQAMSVGLPALVTDVGGMAEVVREAGGGLTIPVGDAAAMGEAMVLLAGDAEARGRFGDNGRAAYERGFTLERMEEAYMALYC